jgi:putative ABC transport system permease protein
MDTLIQDIRYGVRMLLKRPTITAIAVTSLALGIGANTTIFTMIRAVFLSPIPVADSSTLVEIYTEDVRGTSFQFAPTSFMNARDMREQNTVLSGMATFMPIGGVAFRIEGDEAAAQSIPAQMVTGDYFDVLGVEAAAGRLFSYPMAEDERLGAHPEVVISHGLWERLFGGSSDAINATVMLNNYPFTLVGVAAEGFKGTQSVGNPDQIWVHVSMREQLLPPNFVRFLDQRRPLMTQNIGRLAPRVTLEQAQSEFTNIAARLAEEFPEDNEGRTATLVPFSPVNPNQRGQFAGAGTLMMAVVGLVLLIACANVANLLLARAVEREKEIALRVALGAERGRLVRQLLTESVLLALMGGLVGLIIAFWSRDLLWSFRPPFLPDNSVDLSLDGGVLLFTLGVALATGVVFGLVPSLQASSPDLKTTLQEGGRRGTSGTSKAWLRSSLVVAEIALALITLVGAGLFVRSMQNAQQIDPGFDTENLFVFFINTTTAGYDLAQSDQFFDELLQRTRAMPGVEEAALSQNFPLGGGFLRSVFPEGKTMDPDATVLTTTNPVSPGYFRTMGIPVLRGRDFDSTDDESGPWVAIVNEAMAERFWPGEQVLGQRYTFFADPGEPYYQQPIEIVGVVENKLLNLGQPAQPIVYMPYKQWMGPGWTVNVRTAGDPSAVIGAVQGLVREIDANVPVNALTTVEDNLAQQLWAPRMGAAMLSIFGLLALGLAMVGIYGVMANSVDQRVHEMGIRMALGAGRGQVVGLIVRQGMTLVGAGVAAGLIAAVALSRFVENMLFDMGAFDPVTFAVVAGGLLVIALAAIYLPARRLTRLDPAIALRTD